MTQETRLPAIAELMEEFKAKLGGLGVQLQGVMVDHDSLMALRGEAVGTAHLTHDPKYRTLRLRVIGVPITAGDATRQAP